MRAALSVGGFGFPVLLLALAVRQGYPPMLAVDQAVTTTATDITRARGLAAALIVLQAVSHPSVVYVAATLVVVWVRIAKGWSARAVWAFSTMMVGWGVGELMKLVVRRVRPVLDPPLSHPGGYSFPSGHALNITVATTVLLILLWPLLSVSARVLGVGGAVVVVLAVGLDRIFLGVHFPSDVLAGYVLGCCITVSSWIGFVRRTGGTSSSEPSARRS